MRPFPLLVHLLALLLSAPSSAQVVSAKHAQVELIARESSVTPGHDLVLGVHFILEKGWHIYWTNPGDSGQPPSFQWQLSSGFIAGEIKWPHPDKLQSSPTLADYGYHDQVLLIIPVHVTGEKISDKPVDLVTQAKWLICREVCIPDHAELKLTLPEGTPGHGPSAVNQGTAELFAETAKRIPKAWPKSWSAKAESRKEDFLLTIKTGKSVTKAEFYPLDAGQIENAAAQRVNATPQGCTMVLKKSDLLLQPIAELRGVLVVGNGQAYALRVPVNSQAASPPKH